MRTHTNYDLTPSKGGGRRRGGGQASRGNITELMVPLHMGLEEEVMNVRWLY